jgi:Zn2+/Cd2+-exporting ATPase
MTDATRKARFRIGGMDCAACGTKIDSAVRRIEGIMNPSVSVGSETSALEYFEESKIDAVRNAVTRLGYGINRLEDRADGVQASVQSSTLPWWRTPRALLTGACVAALERVGVELNRQGFPNQSQHDSSLLP